ncbi:hypothetical protein ACFSM5_10640 [Lacibacterium aquatile]|uniref:Phage holin family protein n=1 Tax=Lacibacterium aquatile TaxID=1168082 RepID=A0ABW5DRD8_9PROT
MLDRLVRLSSKPLGEAVEHALQRGLKRLLLWSLTATSLGALAVLGLVYLFNGVRLMLERHMLPGEAALVMAAIAFTLVALGCLCFAAGGRSSPRALPIPLTAPPAPRPQLTEMLAAEVQRHPVQSTLAAGVLGVALGANPELSKQLKDLLKSL